MCVGSRYLVPSTMYDLLVVLSPTRGCGRWEHGMVTHYDKKYVIRSDVHSISHLYDYTLSSHILQMYTIKSYLYDYHILSHILQMQNTIWLLSLLYISYKHPRFFVFSRIVWLFFSYSLEFRWKRSALHVDSRWNVSFPKRRSTNLKRKVEVPTMIFSGANCYPPGN